MQLQIVQIANGFIVTSPPTKQGEQPSSYFVENYTALCAYIKQFFPPMVISSIKHN
jgi:hypothetical protein